MRFRGTGDARSIMTGPYVPIMRKAVGQTMTEYALILAGLALVAYGLSPTSGYNYVDDAINALIGKVVSFL
ncbi:MAG: hypothetical protein WB650_24135 [Candidatus Binatus sp.]